MNQESKMEAEPGMRLSAQVYGRAVTDYPQNHFVLKLYVSGITPRSQRAIDNLQMLCEERLPGRYDLEIIDIYQRPVLAKRDQIIAAPTLIKTMPLPAQRVIGDMGDSARILQLLGVVPKERRVV